MDKEQITSFIQTAQQGDEHAFTVLVCTWQDIAVAYTARKQLRNFVTELENNLQAA